VHDRGDLGWFGSFRRQPEDLVLPRGQRVLAALPGRHRELRVDDPAAGRDVADRPGQLLRRRILEHVPGHVRGEGAPKRSRSAQVGEDQRLARGQLLIELRGGGQPVKSGQVDIDDGDVGLVFQRRWDDVRAVLDGGDHFQVGFEFDERDECAAHHGDVLRKEDPQCAQFMLQSWSGR
jgi:hypothetical protein